MRLLLRRTIENLGRIGDIVTVTNGYGRNYLLPQGFAVPVTAANLRQLQAEKLRLARLEAEQREALEVVAEEMARTPIEIKMKAQPETNTLYGSVTSAIIAEACEKKDVDIDPKQVILEEPIKELGDYNVVVKLHPEVSVNVKVSVVGEDE